MRRNPLLLLALALGCKGEPKESAAPLPSVRVVAAAQHPIRPRVAVAGVLAPLPGRDVKVGALVPGRVDRVFVAEGERVRAGQPLAHVEAEPLRQHLVETDAQRESARAAVDNARVKLQ